MISHSLPLHEGIFIVLGFYKNWYNIIVEYIEQKDNQENILVQWSYLVFKISFEMMSIPISTWFFAWVENQNAHTNHIVRYVHGSDYTF